MTASFDLRCRRLGLESGGQAPLLPLIKRY
jgi:hypothetical protein